ncbi:MAG: hypothetical protein HY927_04080 [Elusimicrobia bacterium]|nr:hypothetical protein [Elusimicrobiota bacterium]
MTRRELDECLDEKLKPLRDDLARLEATDRRTAVMVANLAGDVAELKASIPPPGYFTKLMDLMDGMAKGFEDQAQRLWGQASLWQDLHGKVHKDHEPRIVRLESET